MFFYSLHIWSFSEGHECSCLSVCLPWGPFQGSFADNLLPLLLTFFFFIYQCVLKRNTTDKRNIQIKGPFIELAYRMWSGWSNSGCLTLEKPRTWFIPWGLMPQLSQSGAKGSENSWRVSGLRSTLESPRSQFCYWRRSVVALGLVNLSTEVGVSRQKKKKQSYLSPVSMSGLPLEGAAHISCVPPCFRQSGQEHPSQGKQKLDFSWFQMQLN